VSFTIRPKKHLGQHFLKDENIAQKIIAGLPSDVENIIEVGPGTGILTKYLIGLPGKNCYFIDMDKESVDYLRERFPGQSERIIQGDFLRFQPETVFSGDFAVIGNFPYNISSQILFKVLEYRDEITTVVGMVQKEVAERLASGPGTKKYGILSVLLQAYYRIEYLFTVNETVFIPPQRSNRP
jgi:16S rRNA (adenine1518-N6/adenine1519-N6)-dimethyltransferase